MGTLSRIPSDFAHTIMAQEEQAPQALALCGPNNEVDLPPCRPGGITDCTIVGRKPVAGIRSTWLGLADDKRISKEHAIIVFDTPAARWTVENLKANPIYIQKGFATDHAAEAQRLHAGGPAAELASGDAICLAVVDAEHRILIVPAAAEQPPAAAPAAAPCPAQPRAVTGGGSVPAPAKRKRPSAADELPETAVGGGDHAAAKTAAKRPRPSSAETTAAAAVQPRPTSPAGGGVTPVMPMAATPTNPRRRSPAAAAAAAVAAATTTPSPSRKPFAGFAVTFVERGMREKQLQVFKKQLQDGGGRWSINTLITVDGATTHVVANSWRRAAEAVGEAAVGPQGIGVASADWMVQAIKQSKDRSKQICVVEGKYRLLPVAADTDSAVGSDMAWAQVEKKGMPTARVPYSDANYMSARYEPPSGE